MGSEMCIRDRIVNRFKIKSKGEILQARFSGSAILSQSENIGADTIILAYSKKISNNLYDNVWEYVTEYSKCDVVMCSNID